MTDSVQSETAGGRSGGDRGRIRLVHCIGTLKLGGTERQLTELICRLPRTRFDQSLILTQSERAEGLLADRVREAGCEIVPLAAGTRLRKWNPLSVLNLASVIMGARRQMRSHRAQVVHAHLYWSNVVGMLAARAAGVPVRITARRQLGLFKDGRAILQTLENGVNGFTTLVTVNSEAVRRDVLVREKLDAGKIRLIRNGVVLEDFRPGEPEPLRQELGIGEGERVLLTVANLQSYKGHEDLLRAVVGLGERAANVKVLLAGRDAGMQPRLEALAGELGLRDRALFLGARSDVPDLLALADVVVHPSHQEGFSNAILEAMTAGRPVVATDVGGNPEAVADGVNGLIVPPRDPEALGAAIGRLLEDEALRAAMGRAGRERIEREFTIEHTVAGHVRMYEELVAGIGGKS